MVKKVYYPKSITFYCILLLLLSLMGLLIGITVWMFLNSSMGGAVICLLFGLVLISLMLFGFIIIIKTRIFLYQDRVFVCGKRGKEGSVIQFETEIYYAEIEKIYLIMSELNSLGEIIGYRRCHVPHPFIVFACKDGIEKRIDVALFSKKQVARIIDDVMVQVKTFRNDFSIMCGKEMLNEFFEQQKKKNKASRKR